MFSRSRAASLLDVGSSVAGNNMRTVYLLLAATAAVVTCKPQRSNNDFIWYPVDDEDGVFISIYGEKHRTSSTPKYRSHRRARFSGEQNGPYAYHPYHDPRNEYQDPYSSHNDRGRRQPFPELPSSFQYQRNNPYQNNPFLNNQYPNQNFNNPYPNNPFLNNQYPSNQNFNNQYSNDRYSNNPNNQFARPEFNERPQNQKNQVKDEAQFQEILNEVFEMDKHFPREYPKRRPATGNQWGQQNAQLIERPVDNQWIEERPKIPIRPLRPSNRPSNKRPNKPMRTTTESDAVVFPDQTQRTRPAATERPPLTPCERMCPVTPEFNPICGSDSVTYSNSGRLKCAQMCGKDVVLSHYGNCGKSRLVTPPLSDNPRKRRRGNRTRH